MKQPFSYIFLLFLGVSFTLYAQPPKPQEGYRWTLNKEYSDEFNGSELDLTKWYNYHPYWQGRPPAKFTPSQVSVKDGLLVLTNKKIEGSQPGDYWTIAGAAVVSRGEGAHFGYYECRQKASEIRMSSTFWMSNRGAAGPEACNDRYSQELDIQEAVGGAANNSTFRNSMHSNTHYWHTDCNGEKTTYSAGSQIPLEEGEVSDTFHVYAANWKNPNTVEFYLDGKYGKGVSIRTDVDETPFERPMFINMVTETYDWVTPPSDEDLADSTRNTTYIDWVRSWKLVPVDENDEVESETLIQNGGFETGDFSYWTGWGGNPLEVVSDQSHTGNYAAHIGGPGAPEYVVNLRAYTSYTLSCYGKVVQGSGPIFFGIKDASEKVLGSMEVTETSYTKKTIQFTTESSGLSLKFYFYAPNSGAEGYADDFVLTVDNPSDTVEETEAQIFNELVSFDERPNVLPADEQLDIRLVYQTNGNRLIRLKLLNKEEKLIGENLYPAYSGYGLKNLSLLLDSIPGTGKGYHLVAELLHSDSTAVLPSDSDTLTLELQNPVDITIKALDIRDDQPIEGAEVIVNDFTGSTGLSGSIEFLDVAPGMVSIQVTKTGYDKLILPEIEISRDTLLELRLTPETYEVEVGVYDSYTGDIVESALVKMGDQSQTTDYQGLAKFQLYAGAYDLQVSASRYASSSTQVSIASDDELQADLTRVLADAKFVVKRDGSPLHNALVTVGDKSAFTSPIGMANIPNLKTDSLYIYRVDYHDETLLTDSASLMTDSTIRLNITTIGLEDRIGKGEFTIYPNPAGNTISLKGPEGSEKYMVLDANGAMLMQGELNRKMEIDLSTLDAGFYILKVEDYPSLRFVKE